MKLSDLVKSEGYGFVVDPSPGTRPDVVGNPPDPLLSNALLCENGGVKFVACILDCLDFVYSCSHEIAEDQSGHEGHTEWMWTLQTNILARWVKKVTEPTYAD